MRSISLLSALLWSYSTHGFQVVVHTAPLRRLSTVGSIDPSQLTLRGRLRLHTGDNDDNDESSAISNNNSHDNEEPEVAPSNRLKRFFRRNKSNDPTTFRQKLGKLGLATALSYGWVSNMSYSVTVSLAWYIHSKRTGLSPLATGQWPKFLAVYAGFYVFNNFVRPIRLAMSVAISPKFDDIVKALQQRLNVNKATAITITVILANVVGTTVCMCSGILLAATCAGVPVFVGK